MVHNTTYTCPDTGRSFFIEWCYTEDWENDETYISSAECVVYETTTSTPVLCLEDENAVHAVNDPSSSAEILHYLMHGTDAIPLSTTALETDVRQLGTDITVKETRLADVQATIARWIPSSTQPNSAADIQELRRALEQSHWLSNDVVKMKAQLATAKTTLTAKRGTGSLDIRAAVYAHLKPTP